MIHTPFFSIIVCTRNRPDVIKHCLWSLQNQTFKDFEVILSDNSDPDIKEINYKTVSDMHFSQLKYIAPDRVLNMHENYNFATDHGVGEYIGALTDKNLLKKNALLDLYNFLKNNKVDIINYAHTGCHWYPHKIFQWIASEATQSEARFEPYEPKDELLRRFSLDRSIRDEGREYNFGKIFFGFYHNSLISQLKERYKNIFHFCSPDYTSTVLALDCATTAIYFHKKIMVAINSYMGNGRKGATVPGALRNFLKTCVQDELALLDNLPIPSVYTIHNLCAYDYQILNRFGNHRYQINITNLAQRVYEDLQIFPFASEDEKKSLYECFFKFIEEKEISISFTHEETPVIPSYRKTKIKRIIRFLLKNKDKKMVLKDNFFKIFNYHITLKSLLK